MGVHSSMETTGKRASERIELEMSIEIAGTDCLGFQFFDRTRTVVISRHGGKIVLERKLAPQQEVTVRCLSTGLEAAACIVGQLEKCTGSYCYGIKFLDEKDNIWDIKFPPLTDSDKTMGRALLECMGCKMQEMTYLDDLELEVLELNGDLSRLCKHCQEVSYWRKSKGEMPEPEVRAPPPPLSPPPAPTPSPAPAQPKDRRREPRRETRVTACVRTSHLGQDMVKTRNVSRGGLCFTSPWEYAEGEDIEVAVPYSPGGGNIFLPAKIVWVNFLESEGTRIYGAAYQFRKD